MQRLYVSAVLLLAAVLVVQCAAAATSDASLDAAHLNVNVS
jgi:hypothetical protein